MEQNIVGNKIVTLCAEKNIPLEELSERSGLTQSQIDTIINSNHIPTLGSLIKIARALGVRLGTFLDDSEELGAVIQRKSEVKQPVISLNRVAGTNSHMDFYALAAQKSGRYMEPFFVTLKPLSAEQSPTFSVHEGEEFIYVLQGEVKFHYGNNEHILCVGDSIYYDSIVEHRVEAVNDESAQILVVAYTPM